MAKTAQDNSVNNVDQRNTQQEENEDTEKEDKSLKKISIWRKTEMDKK